jgi:hypothetical protein
MLMWAVPSVRFVLLGDTFAHNDQLVAAKQGVPANIANQVILVARQYDGWSDYPTIRRRSSLEKSSARISPNASQSRVAK